MSEFQEASSICGEDGEQDFSFAIQSPPFQVVFQGFSKKKKGFSPRVMGGSSGASDYEKNVNSTISIGPSSIFWFQISDSGKLKTNSNSSGMAAEHAKIRSCACPSG